MQLRKLLLETVYQEPDLGKRDRIGWPSHQAAEPRGPTEAGARSALLRIGATTGFRPRFNPSNRLYYRTDVEKCGIYTRVTLESGGR